MPGVFDASVAYVMRCGLCGSCRGLHLRRRRDTAKEELEGQREPVRRAAGLEKTVGRYTWRVGCILPCEEAGYGPSKRAGALDRAVLHRRARARLVLPVRDAGQQYPLRLC